MKKLHGIYNTFNVTEKGEKQWLFFSDEGSSLLVSLVLGINKSTSAREASLHTHWVAEGWL